MKDFNQVNYDDIRAYAMKCAKTLHLDMGEKRPATKTKAKVIYSCIRGALEAYKFHFNGYDTADKARVAATTIANTAEFIFLNHDLGKDGEDVSSYMTVYLPIKRFIDGRK